MKWNNLLKRVELSGIGWGREVEVGHILVQEFTIINIIISFTKMRDHSRKINILMNHTSLGLLSLFHSRTDIFRKDRT